MRYKENEERNSKLKTMLSIAAGITATAFMVKEGSGTKAISKALGDIVQSASGISDDLSKLSFREVDSANIQKIFKSRISDDNSTYKLAKQKTTIGEIDQSRGLFSSIRELESFKGESGILDKQIKDNLQAQHVLKTLREEYKDQSRDFFEEAQKLTQEVLNKKQQFFESETGDISTAIRSEFEFITDGGIFDGQSDRIANVFEEALLTSKKILEDADIEYKNTLKPQLLKEYEEQLMLGNKDGDKFFKETLDRAANVNDFIRAYDNKAIDNTEEITEMYNILSKYRSENNEFGELIIDNKTLRMDKHNEIYSMLSMNKVKTAIEEEVADTIPGKLFGMRSALINRQAEDFTYLGQGTYDKVLASLTNEESGILKYDHFKIGSKTFQYKDQQLRYLEEADDLYLAGGKHGPMASIMNTLSGNTYFNPVENEIAKQFDLGTKGITSFREKAGVFKKFKQDSEWMPNVVKRLFNTTYDNALGDEKRISSFFKDLNLTNKMYNDQTIAPSNKFMKEFKENTTSDTARALLGTLDEKNVAQSIIDNNIIDHDNFSNKDLTTLITKYKREIQSVNQSIHIGDMKGTGGGKNILDYNKLLKREVVKESLIKNANFRSSSKVSGYAITKAEIDVMNISGAEKKNANDLLNWTILQREGSLYSSSSHNKSSVAFKESQYKNLNELLKTQRSNSQEQEFLQSFQNGLKTFAKENSSVFESIEPRNNKIIKPYETNTYVAMRKAVTPMDLIKSLNDETKLKATSKKFVKQFYAGRDNMNDVTTATLFPFHMLNRLTTPLESMGLGFSKDSTKSVLDLGKNIGLKRILPVMAGAGLLSYLNYESENLTGTSLSEAKANAAATFTLGLKSIEDTLGLHDNSRRTRMYNPIAKYWGGDYQDKEEYLNHLEYGYDPIRKGRFWSFGSSSEFRGSKVSYFKPNDLRLAHSNYYDESVYGGSKEKWKHSLIPTLRHPLSTIRALTNPYWLEKKHYEDRPYPVSGKLFTEGTPWGAILNPTVGAILKPQIKMHKREMKGTVTDVRTLIADKNNEIRLKSAERNLVKLNGSGFTPMAFNPSSMPSMGESVFSINIEGGRVSSAGFKGQQYAESLNGINTAVIAEQSAIQSESDSKSFGTSAIQSSMTDSNNSSSAAAITSLVRLGLSSGAVGSGSATHMVNEVNKSIFARAESTNQGIINEIGTLHNKPFRDASDKQKDDYLQGMISGESKSDFTHGLMYSGKQLSGMYGFLAGQILPASKGVKLESANMKSFANRFWDTSVGGIGGDFMEIARRFFPHEDHNITQVNNIRNTMPDWLPEQFQTGDPYTTMPLGDARMPGKGYESLNKLHSDNYGRYGSYDRYKILADIAPTSEEFKTWKKIAKEQVTDPFLKKDMENIEKRVKEQTKEHDFYNYKFLKRDLEEKDAVIEEVSNSGKFKIVGNQQQFTLAGIKPMKDEELGSQIHRYLTPGMQVKLKYENNEFRNRDKEGNISSLVIFNEESISKKMFEDKTGKEKSEKETLADEYFALNDSNISAGHVYEAIGHMPIPFLHNKFMRIDSPMESYKKEQVYGSNFSTWNNPIKGFVQPAFQQAWGQGIGMQALGLSTFVLSNVATNSGASEGMKTLAHTAFAATNAGGFAGGVIGALPFMTLGSNQSKIGWNARNLSNAGAVVGAVGYGLANLGNPLLSVGNFAVAGIAIADQLQHVTKAGKKIAGAEGALIGAAVGLGLSALKNPEFSLTSLTDKYIPKDTEKKWEIEEYFDRLEYLKYNNLYEKAAKKAKRKEGTDVKKIVNKFEYNREKNVDKIRDLHEQKTRVQKTVMNEKMREQLSMSIDGQISQLQSPEQYFEMGEYTKAALAYKKAADTTIYGLNEYASSSDVLRALPKYDRDFFLEFAKEKDPKERKKLLKYISPYKQKAMKVLWKEDLDETEQKSNKEFFSTHRLPNLSWSGWKPNVDLDNVKMKTIENEGMLLSDFGIYESKKEEPAYINSPGIKEMNQSSSPLAIQRDLLRLLNGSGLQGVEVSVDQSQSPGLQVVSNITRMASYNLQENVRSMLGNIF